MKRAAVIGLGTIAPIHLHAIASNPEIELVAVCDIDPAARERAPQGVPFFADYVEMIGAVHPDVVHICLPHYLHAPVAMKAAELGCNVFCEKPVALNRKQAEAFADFADAHPEVHIGICLQNRRNRSVETLKGIIDGGEYGKVTGARGVVLWARTKEYYEAAPWRGTWTEAGGGSMINQSVHTLDLLYHLVGDIGSVRSSVSQLLEYGIEVEDTVSARLFFENGAHGLFYATNANYRNENVQIAVQMEKAEFAIENNALYRVAPDGERELVVRDDRLPGTKFYYGASHSKLINEFYTALENGTDDYIHVRDAVMSIRLIDAIQQAGRYGRRIEVL